jgi:sugar phosphate permease
MKRLVFLSGVLGALFFAITSIVGGLKIEGYSFVSQFISESYATGVPNARYLRIGFIISGVLLTIFGIGAPFLLRCRKLVQLCFFLFTVFYGLGTVVTSLYPCDFGCPSDLNVSFSQIVHNAMGFLTYAIVPLALILIGGLSLKKEVQRPFFKMSLICGIVALVFVLFLFENPTGPYIGLAQRTIEGSILIWVIYTAFHVRNSVSKENPKLSNDLRS